MIANLIIGCYLILAGGCSPEDNPQLGSTTDTTTTVTSVTLNTDKACYAPGETISFTASSLPSSAHMRYYHLGDTIYDQAIASNSWTWTPPASDYQGYLAEVYNKSTGGTEQVLGCIGIDVSSDWKRFPRYGFLSDFGDTTDSYITSTAASLNRYHLNGIQFYDWHNKHHQPLAGTRDHPDSHWTDIAKRNTAMSTVKGYISALHGYKMKAMFYNLCFGALSDAASDGVQENWYTFKDRNHSEKDDIELSSSMFKSNIYITDPGNTYWQNYLAQRNDDVYAVYDFDGYHIDQLGSRGTVYNYNGDSVDLPSGYASFITAMKKANPNKLLVMNSVSRFGAEKIANTGNMDFLYNEVWNEDAAYSALKSIIDENATYGNGSLKTIFAAYMNYNKGDNKGYFNTPGVILADAVMFALGGAHLEMGEHMLCKEYFPNENLQMDGTLKKAMVNYYDFLTAYENLLRDGGTFNSVNIDCTNGKMSVASWPPSSGNVCVLGKQVTNGTQVIHLINLAKANSLNWRDLDGNMPEPSFLTNPSLRFVTSRSIKRIWMASPDLDGGICKEITFNQSNSSVSFTLPSLKYWDMIVIEYK